MLQNVVKPWVDTTYPGMAVVWQQDSALSHRAKMTQDWCKENFPAFWPWSMWPPSSPDLNPLEYGIWGYAEREVCRTSHPSVDALKAAVDLEWARMSEAYIRKTCSVFRPRLEAMLAADGGHFEK